MAAAISAGKASGVHAKLGTPNSERIFYLRHAFRVRINRDLGADKDQKSGGCRAGRRSESDWLVGDRGPEGIDNSDG
jgi:hypothetical protein